LTCRPHARMLVTCRRWFSDSWRAIHPVACLVNEHEKYRSTIKMRNR
jgi:hypothetical protein